MRTETTLWDIEFGPRIPNRVRPGFGPFPTREDAENLVRQLLEDNPHFFDSGYEIVGRPGTTNRYFSVQEAANRLGISKSRVLTLIREDRLPATKIGSQWALHEHDVKNYQPQPTGRPKKGDDR